MTKLHLGCGSKYIPGFVHIDSTHYRHLDYCADVSHLPMIPDLSVDLIYACHVLEHFDRSSFPMVLQEWYNKLNSGGVLRLSVPDFESIVDVYLSEGFKDGLSGLIGLLVGGQRDASDFHKMIFDYNLLSSCLYDAGFAHCRHWDWRSTEHSRIDDYSQAYLPHLDKVSGRLMSLNIEAVK